MRLHDRVNKLLCPDLLVRDNDEARAGIGDGVARGDGSRDRLAAEGSAETAHDFGSGTWQGQTRQGLRQIDTRQAESARAGDMDRVKEREGRMWQQHAV